MLSNLVGIVDSRKRIGRGGKRGGTSGRGHKGQKARTSGPVRPMFEGGQMPLFRRLPKRGFNNAQFAKLFEIVNLDQLERAFENGDQVNCETLHSKGLIHAKRGYGVKVLGRGELSKALIVSVDSVSKTAVTAITTNKGKVEPLNQEI